MVNHGRGGSKSYGHKHKHDHAGKKSQTQAVKLLITPSPLWHEVELGPLGANAPIPSEAEVEDLLSKAKYLYEEEVKNYDKLKHDGKADWEFLSTVLKSGTVTDKVSAFTLMVQESPIHTLPVLRDHLVHGMARKKSRREALLTVDAIRDLAIGNILPDRRLRYFRDHPLKATGVTPTHLLLWYFEDALKKLYFEFLNILEELSKDPLTEIKSKALSYIADLLIGKPEQEANLLLLLVNKLGDQDRKVSSKASFLLCTVLQKHPVMSLTISREVERFIFRNGMNERSKYMALNFLNQIVLSNKDQDVACAKALVDIYMAVFEQLAKSESIREQRGPLEKEELKAVKKTPPKKKDSKKKDVKKDAAPKEDIGKVNSKILGAIFIGVNRAFPFAKLTETAFEKHLQTIYKITHVGTFNVSIQALSLVYQIETANSKPLSDRFYRSLYATLLDSRLTKTSKYAVYLNLIYRAVKNDSLVVRVQAFLKRLLQLCSIMTSPFTCASLFMFSEIARSKPGVWSLVLQPEDNTEESFGDVDEDGTTTAKAGKPSRIAGYDWKKRDPMHSLANASCLWELNALALHFHPTVSFYAKQLLTGKPIAAPESVASYDPLQNHTLSRFLDRFVYKNPKRTDTLYRGTSVMQPKMPGVKNSKKESLVVGGRKKGMIVKGVDGEKDIYTDDAPVNSVDWANVNEATIPTDEVGCL
ncbi:CBF/Mak21 family-domain-containing protein [Chytridium lagenaria]|nr:CBF/Mak21 family-domain-containing protein [Chytridium lagenaria]